MALLAELSRLLKSVKYPGQQCHHPRLAGRAFASPWYFGGAPVSKPAYRVLLLQGVRQAIRAL